MHKTIRPLDFPRVALVVRFWGEMIHEAATTARFRLRKRSDSVLRSFTPTRVNATVEPQQLLAADRVSSDSKRKKDLTFCPVILKLKIR